MMSRISLLVCALALVASTVRAQEAPPAPPPPPAPDVVPAVPAVPAGPPPMAEPPPAAPMAPPPAAPAPAPAPAWPPSVSFKSEPSSGNTLKIGLLVQPQFQMLGSNTLDGTRTTFTSAARGSWSAERCSASSSTSSNRLPEPVPGDERRADGDGQCHHHQGHAGDEHPGRLHHLEGVRRHRQGRRRLHAAADGPQRCPGSDHALFLGLLRVLVPAAPPTLSSAAAPTRSGGTRAFSSACWLLDGHIEFRIGLFQGLRARQPAASGTASARQLLPRHRSRADQPARSGARIFLCRAPTSARRRSSRSAITGDIQTSYQLLRRRRLRRSAARTGHLHRAGQRGALDGRGRSSRSPSRPLSWARLGYNIGGAQPQPDRPRRALVGRTPLAGSPAPIRRGPAAALLSGRTGTTRTSRRSTCGPGREPKPTAPTRSTSSGSSTSSSRV